MFMRDEIGLLDRLALGRLPQRRREELVAHGRCRSVRAVQRDPFRPRRAPERRAGVHPRPQRDVSPLARGLEPGLHGVRAPRGWFADPSAGRASTPVWVSSVSRASCSRSRRTTTPTCSRRSTPGCGSLGHDPDAFEQERFSYQVIADHSRAVTFLIADDVLPSNEGRAMSCGDPAASRPPWTAARSARAVHGRQRVGGIDVMADAYPYLVEKRDRILSTITREEAQFARTLDAGTIQLEEAPHPADVRRSGHRSSTRGPARQRAAAARRHRVPAPRYVRVPGRPDGGARRRVRRRYRSCRVRRRARRAAPTQPLRQEGRARPACGADLAVQRIQGAPVTATSSAMRRPRPRAAWSRSSATGWSSTS